MTGAGQGRLARFFSPQNRYLPPLFITCILLGGHLTFGILESSGRTLLAIGTSIACELFLCRSVKGKWPHLASAYVSGISVGMLVRSPESVRTRTRASPNAPRQWIVPTFACVLSASWIRTSP